MARIATALLAAIFSFIFCSAPVCGENTATASVEWPVSISEVVTVGSLAEVRESKGPGEAPYEDCALQVTELLKSPAQQAEIRFTFRRLNRDLSLSDWMNDGTQLLVLLSRAKDYGSEQRLSGALVPTSMNFPLSLVNLARPGKYLINTRFEVLENGAEALRTARDGLRALNYYQISEKGKKPEVVRVEATYDSEAHKILYAGSACYLDVPNFMAKKTGLGLR
jgi:hypothetical protein